MTKEELKKELGSITDPSAEKTLAETNGIKHIDISDDVVTLIIGLEKTDDIYVKSIKRDLARKIKLDLGFKGVKAEFQLNKLSDSILSREVKYIGIASGKGGVGKSTVTANLAYALKRLGKKVGIIDADIYGSSIPTLLDMPIKTPRSTKDEKIIPFNVDDIEVISTAFFLPQNKPLMWRGPMLGKMLNHFFYDVLWDDEIEYILVDLPPGTGDVAMDIQKLIPACEMIIVTTPHPSASYIAVKAGFAAKELKHELLGVVENMTQLVHKGETLKIFGEGGGEEVANKLDTELLAQIEIGQPEDHITIFDAKEEIGVSYLGLANKVLKANK